MTELFVDIETFASVDLAKSGLYRYSESLDFEVILFGFSVDGGEVRVVDLASGEDVPDYILYALGDPSVVKWAHNAAFERICLSRFLGLPKHVYLDPKQWRCTMVWSAYLGLPLSLESVGAVLNLTEQKLKEGKDLIRFFCKPCTPTKSNSGRMRNLPGHAPEKWISFKAYNKRDVETEMAISAKLNKYPVPNAIWSEYHLDQRINDTGIAIDMDFVHNAITANERARAELLRQMKVLTGLDNPNSVEQFKSWLRDEGYVVESVDKKYVSGALKTASEHVKEVLTLRQAASKSSTAKYAAMENVVCSDMRAKGLYQFYGAHTGRWSSRLIQIQNLPQNHLPELEDARALVQSGNYDTLALLYDNVPNVLSELIRTAFVAEPGKQLIVGDFSSIEAVTVAWLAGEQWVLDAYREKRDLYIENAEKMFHRPKGSVGKKDPLRQKAKLATLACGYQGSVAAMRNFGALDLGLTEGELLPIVTAWRSANPNIVQFWWQCDKAAQKAVREQSAFDVRGIWFSYKSGNLFITLPSGRDLVYTKPYIGENRFGNDAVIYNYVNAQHKWGKVESSPGKWVENLCQAVARDLLVYAMQTLDMAGYRIIGHVHDEVIVEAPPDASVENVCELMCELPAWAKGLPLRAEGFSSSFYRKD